MQRRPGAANGKLKNIIFTMFSSFYVSIDAAAVDLVWRRGKSLVEGFFQFEPRGAI